MRFAADEKSATTLAMLGECFAELGGTPQVVLADRMGCLKGGVVANRVVPTGDYVRFALHYRFRPDFCEGAAKAQVTPSASTSTVASGGVSWTAGSCGCLSESAIAPDPNARDFAERS